MEEEEFIAEIRLIAWMSYQLGAGEAVSGYWTNDQKESMLDGVRYLKRNPESTTKENHENWARKKLEQGWKRGDRKNMTEKTHPDLIPYDELADVEAKKNVATMFAHAQAEELWQKMELLKDISEDELLVSVERAGKRIKEEEHKESMQPNC